MSFGWWKICVVVPKVTVSRFGRTEVESRSSSSRSSQRRPSPSSLLSFVSSLAWTSSLLMNSLSSLDSQLDWMLQSYL